MENEISRRSFLGGLGIASVTAAGLALTGCGSTPASSDPGSKKEEEIVASSEVSADLVIVGGGYSGLVAAVQAGELGKKVIVLEKDPQAGGTGAMTEGICGVNTSFQKDQGIVMEQTVEDLVYDEMQYNRYRTPQNVWRRFLHSTGDTVEWLAENGVGIGKVTDQAGVGESTPVFHWWVMEEGEHGGGMAGSLMIASLLKKIEEYGGQVITESPAVKIVMESEDTVKGVIATKGGENIQYNGPVILATGGYSANHEFVTMVTGYDATRMACPAPGGAGDGLAMALEAGARQSALNFFVGGRYVVGSNGAQASIAALIQEFVLYVNNCGVRFMNEDLAKKMSTYADNQTLMQPAAYSLVDSATIKRLMAEGNRVPFMWFPVGASCASLQEELDDILALNEGSVFKGNSIAELAEAAEIDPETLQATVDKYNADCKAGVDSEYGKDPMYLEPVETGPFYLVRHDRSAVRSAGAVDIDNDNRVVMPGGKTFKNLFAVGTDGCVLYDSSYNFHIPATMSAWCAYSGRNAAKAACKL